MQYYDNYVKQRKTEPEPSRHQASPHHEMSMVQPEASKREYQKLGGVFGVIVLAATIMSFVLGFDWQIWFEWFMGGFFIIFGSFKLIGYEMFIMMFPEYDPIAKRSKLYTYVYPFVELFLGFLYVANLLPLFRDIVTFVIFSISAYGVLQYTSKNPKGIQCACLGNIIKLPLSTVSLIEDVLMAAMSGIMIISYFIL